jgi:hypothetical protein
MTPKMRKKPAPRRVVGEEQAFVGDDERLVLCERDEALDDVEGADEDEQRSGKGEQPRPGRRGAARSIQGASSNV